MTKPFPSILPAQKVTHEQMMKAIKDSLDRGLINLDLDNEGQYIIYTNFYEQLDGSISTHYDPKYADAVANPEDYCDECGAEYPEGATSDIGEYHNENCSLHPVNQVSEALDGVDNV